MNEAEESGSEEEQDDDDDDDDYSIRYDLETKRNGTKRHVRRRNYLCEAIDRSFSRTAAITNRGLFKKSILSKKIILTQYLTYVFEIYSVSMKNTKKQKCRNSFKISYSYSYQYIQLEVLDFILLPPPLGWRETCDHVIFLKYQIIFIN